MQSLRMATTEAQSLHQQVQSKNKQGSALGAASMPFQGSQQPPERPTKSQAAGSSDQSPKPHKLLALSSDLTSLQQGPSFPEEKCMDGSQQGAPESPKILQGSQQELQGLLSQVQALEKEAESTVDVQALRRLFEAVPQLRRAPQAPAVPCKPEVSVEQAFGELTKVSTEVARLKEQTLARLMDIEEAVHKALSSMSSLQPGANTRGHSQVTPKDHGARKISVTDSSRDKPDYTGQEIRVQTAVKSQKEVTCHSEVQHQAKVVGQAQLYQKGVQDKAGKKEVTQCSGQPEPVPTSASSLPTRRQKSVLELQTRPGGSQCHGATRTVTEQYESVDQCGNTALTSPTMVTEPTESLRGPGPHPGLHASPLMRQFLRSPAGLSGGLAEAGMVRVPCGHSQPAAQ
ncbi:hypothetical protein CB1_000295011 [Camelus ferus]|nr:hypothetical protein CB1_000295011 [Camelus ferus]